MKFGLSVSFKLLLLVVAVGSTTAATTEESSAANGGSNSLLRKNKVHRRVLEDKVHQRGLEEDPYLNLNLDGFVDPSCRWLLNPKSLEFGGWVPASITPEELVVDENALVRRLSAKQQSPAGLGKKQSQDQRRMDGEIPVPPKFEETEERKQPAWPHEKSEIPLDPAITYGELENGFRYMVMPNKDPPGQLELMLHIDAGSLTETDAEQGIAHYLEHMMFQTTKSQPEGGIFKVLERLGIRFNAYTTFDETVYFASLPDMEEETMTTAWNWMRDVMDGALLETTEIDKERGVIISELEQGESVFRRLQLAAWDWMLPDARLNQRLPIGLEENILAFNKQDFDDFYQKYYTPRMATFIVVGDMEATDMVAMIEETFASVVDVGPRPEEPDFGPGTPGLGFRTNVFYDAEVREDQLNMEVMTYSLPKDDTELNRYESMKRSVANRILSDRFRERATKEEDSPIQVYSRAGSYQLYDWINPSITVTPIEGRWRDAVAVLEQEWRRVIQYGFTQFEMDQAKAELLKFYEQQVLSKDTRDSGMLSSRLNGAINPGRVVSTPEENLRIATAIFEAITLQSLQEAFVEDWDTPDINLYMNTNTMDYGSIEEVSQELKDLFVASSEVEIDPPVEKEAVPWAYTDFGPPGTVVEDTYVEDLGFRQLILSNNIRVNMMKTNFSAASISFTARFGTGKVSQPKDATSLDSFSSYVFRNGGLGEHEDLELDDILASSTARSSFGIGSGSFSFGGGSNPDDLEQALQLMTAQVIDTAYREEAVALFRADIPWRINSIRFSDYGASNELNAWLLGNDKRFTNPTEEDLFSYEASDARDWLAPYVNSSYMEFSIVGDFDEETTLDLILSTIGTLPEREDAPVEITDEDRFVDIPEPQSKTATYETADPKAQAVVVWKAPLSAFLTKDIDTDRQFNVLSRIFSDKLFDKIREELGGAYSTFAYKQASGTFDYSFLNAIAYGNIDEVEFFTTTILEIAEGMANGDTTEDDLERAIAGITSSLQDAVRENYYWLSVISTSQTEPYTLDWARSYTTEYFESISLDQINALAAEYLIPDLAYPMAIIPVNVTTTEEDA